MQFSRGGGAVHPAIGVTGYEGWARKGGKSALGEKRGEREREGKRRRRRWSAYTETHVRTRGAARSVVCQVRPVT